MVPGRFLIFDAPHATDGHARGAAFYADALAGVGAVVVVGLDGAGYDPQARCGAACVSDVLCFALEILSMLRCECCKYPHALSFAFLIL
jgi:hypothetical protein